MGIMMKAALIVGTLTLGVQSTRTETREQISARMRAFYLTGKAEPSKPIQKWISWASPKKDPVCPGPGHDSRARKNLMRSRPRAATWEELYSILRGNDDPTRYIEHAGAYFQYLGSPSELYSMFCGESDQWDNILGKNSSVPFGVYKKFVARKGDSRIS